MLRPIDFAETALCDLEDIHHWYAEQQVPDVGERLVRELFVKVEQLTDFPESGRIVPEFGMKTVRELLHPPFRLVYRIDSSKIWIIRVWRSERLMCQMSGHRLPKSNGKKCQDIGYPTP